MRDDEGSTPRNLGDLLKHFRRRAALTQREAAGRAKMSVGGLCDVEQGRVVRPRPDTLRRLADALRLSSAETAELIQLSRQGPVLADDLRLLMLGPLDVRVDGARVELGSARQRTLLGVLALSPGTAVSRDALVETLWGPAPPATAAGLLQTYVYRLRQRLRPARARRPEALTATSGGYQLVVDDDQLDLLAFRRLVRDARHDRENARLESAYAAYRQATALWRGAPLADLPGLELEPRIAELAMLGRTVVAEYADTAFALGRHDEVLPLLRGLTGLDPLDEGTHARLMIALSGAGRQAAALEVYRELRGRLADELGVAPGPGLREAQQAILRGGPDGTAADPADARRPASAMPTPCQLPADVRGFAGRTGETAWLDAVLLDRAQDDTKDGGQDGTARVAALLGTAGAGKSALALHWAHAVADRFEDGQLYADLAGHAPDGPPTRPADTIRAFVRALGVAPQHVPNDETELAALYRSLLADRRMLVVLDNARDAGQVRPLLPGSSRSRVLVTSRDQLRGLVAMDGALPLTVDRLSLAEARRMLSGRLGRERVAAELPAVEEIITGCAGLPLALVTVAAHAAINPGFSLAALAAGLRDPARTLTALDAAAEGPGIRGAFARSYATLSPDAAHLFRLFGLHSGFDIDAPGAAVLTGAPAGEARVSLAGLAGVGLMTEHAPGRYTTHNLLRLYAAELARADDRGDTGRATADVSGDRSTEDRRRSPQPWSEAPVWSRCDTRDYGRSPL
ncbi:MAG: BTAD domain-containing putative transcriptional regulator [Actinoallomurus sp.]